jgi:hypothetical protein
LVSVQPQYSKVSNGETSRTPIMSSSLLSLQDYDNMQSASAVLIRIQKSLQKCSPFILGLIAFAAERDQSSVYTDMLKDLRDQLKNENYGRIGYAKGYYDSVSSKLEADMKKLRKGLEEYTIPT